jgi:hypothetical protein
MNSQPVASDLSYFVLERQRQEAQGIARGFDCTHQRLRTITGYNPRVFVGDPDFGQPEGGDSATPNPLTRAVGEAE